MKIQPLYKKAAVGALLGTGIIGAALGTGVYRAIKSAIPKASSNISKSISNVGAEHILPIQKSIGQVGKSIENLLQESLAPTLRDISTAAVVQQKLIKKAPWIFMGGATLGGVAGGATLGITQDYFAKQKELELRRRLMQH